MPEYRGSGMWASARAVVSVKRVRIVASGNFPVIGLRLVVPLRARRVGSYKAELVGDDSPVCRSEAEL